MPVFALVVAAVIVAATALIFNKLVRLRNAARGAWSDIDVQLKRRHDLVPRLVEAVGGYASYERATLQSVTEARGSAVQALGTGDPAQAGPAESRLSEGLRRFLALAEAYPDLKAAARFMDLQRSLVEIEGDIQNARRYYNAVVRDLNTRIQSFPDLAVARPLGFREMAFFELEDPTEAAAPRVDLEAEP